MNNLFLVIHGMPGAKKMCDIIFYYFKTNNHVDI